MSSFWEAVEPSNWVHQATPNGNVSNFDLLGVVIAVFMLFGEAISPVVPLPRGSVTDCTLSEGLVRMQKYLCLSVDN